MVRLIKTTTKTSQVSLKKINTNMKTLKKVLLHSFFLKLTHSQNTTKIPSSLTTSVNDLYEIFIKDAIFKEKLLSHGCWCSKLNPDQLEVGLGGYQAVDDLDQICKDWAGLRHCSLFSDHCQDMDFGVNRNYTLEYDVDEGDAVCGDRYPENYDVDGCMAEVCEIDVYIKLVILRIE